MSADVLRQAASLMRERAEAATASPWENRRGPGEHVIAKHDAVATVISLRPREDRRHIASWHPAVALAVADWLEVVAARNEALLSSFAEGSRAGAVTAAENTLGWPEALAVAHAYLGTT